MTPGQNIPSLTLFTLSAATVVWHGTDCAGSLARPDGPLWVTEDRGRACQWARWKSQPADGRPPGPLRVISYTVRRPVQLVDTVAVERWEALGRWLAGTPEPGPWTLALACRRQGLAGWRGTNELLLCDPGVLIKTGEQLL